MTSWNGGEDSDDLDDQTDDFRDHIGPADPPPVTEAMITPRTSPTAASAGVGDDATGVVCRVCDEQNQPGASYCLACGVSLTVTPDPEPLPWVDSDEPEFDAGAGLLDLGEMDEVAPPPSPRDENSDSEESAPSVMSRISLRQVLMAVVTVAVLFLLYTTFVSRDSQSAASSSTTVTVNPSALESYVSSVMAIAATVVELQTDAAEINSAWEARTTEYQPTLTALSGLESRAAALPDLLRALTAPDVFEVAAHQRLVASANTIAAAASEMVEGLEAPDTGEVRRAALSKFDAASIEFASLARVVEQSTESLTSTATNG